MSDNNVPVLERGIPLVGQPCTILTWFPTLSLVCNCEAKQPLLVVGIGNVAECPKCGRGFQLHGVMFDVRTGKPPHFELNIVLPGRVAAGVAAPGVQPS